MHPVLILMLLQPPAPATELVRVVHQPRQRKAARPTELTTVTTATRGADGKLRVDCQPAKPQSEPSHEK